MDNEWEEILSDYNKAREALWGNGKSGWQRNQEVGRYHLWKAYHHAALCEPQNQLLYARILSMMESESRFPYSDYERLQKFIRPAADAYNVAILAGQQPTEKELEKNRFWNESLQYRLECENLPGDEQIKWISGSEIEKFGAIELPREHPFSIGFTGNATTRIREAYNYVWTEDNS